MTGVLMWELLAQDPRPYGSLSNQTVMKGVVEGVLKLKLPESVPEGFHTLLSACCDHDAARRPTMPDVMTALTSLCC
jgi:hypothetical protein